MPTNYVKSHVLTMVSPINADENKPTKDVVVERITHMFSREDQSVYSPEKILNEIERLILTGQMIIKPDGLAVLGVPIFEDGQEVSSESEEISKSVFSCLQNKFSSATKNLDNDIIDEIINSVAVIVDKSLNSESAIKGTVGKSKSISKEILENLKGRRGFRQYLDMMTKDEIKSISTGIADNVNTCLLKIKLDNNLSNKIKSKKQKI